MPDLFEEIKDESDQFLLKELSHLKFTKSIIKRELTSLDDSIVAINEELRRRKLKIEQDASILTVFPDDGI